MNPRIPGSHLRQIHDAIESIAPDVPFWQVEEVIDRICEIVYDAKSDYTDIICTVDGEFFHIRKE